MSTTTDREVAIEYASSAPGALVLELEQGLLDRGVSSVVCVCGYAHARYVGMRASSPPSSSLV